MVVAASRWVKMNSAILVNAGSLIGTTAVTSVLGFVYWWLAAREFSPNIVGFASALVSTMMLLGECCMLGLGTLLITELPRQPGKAASLVSTALTTVGCAGACVGVLFAVVVPRLSVGFQPLGAGMVDVAIFALGVGFTSMALVLDSALVGLLRGSLQLGRNIFFAVAKLLVLFGASIVLSHATGVTIYGTWAAGSLLSLLMVLGFAAFKRGITRDILPQWQLLKKLGFAALMHHLLNLTLKAPTLTLPLLVTVLLSTKMNAWFYVSWMIASFVFTVPSALTIVLHATNSARRTTVAFKVRLTMGIALITVLLANCLLQSGTSYILGLFGASYAEQAVWPLRILAIAAFPLTIKYHYISICRIQDRIARAMLAMLPGGILELCLAVVGAHFGSLSGLCLGWLLAISLEAIFMFSTVYHALGLTEKSLSISTSTAQLYSQAPEIVYGGAEPIWLIETMILPVVRLVQQESDQSGSHSVDTLSKQRLKPTRLQSFQLYAPHEHVMPAADKRTVDHP